MVYNEMGQSMPWFNIDWADFFIFFLYIFLLYIHFFFKADELGPPLTGDDLSYYAVKGKPKYSSQSLIHLHVSNLDSNIQRIDNIWFLKKYSSLASNDYS